MLASGEVRLEALQNKVLSRFIDLISQDQATAGWRYSRKNEQTIRQAEKVHERKSWQEEMKLLSVFATNQKPNERRRLLLFLAADQ